MLVQVFRDTHTWCHVIGIYLVARYQHKVNVCICNLCVGGGGGCLAYVKRETGVPEHIILEPYKLSVVKLHQWCPVQIYWLATIAACGSVILFT